MCYKRIFPALAAVLLFTTHSYAQHADVTLQPGDAQLVEAYRQRTLQKKELVAADTHFIIVWQSQDYPRSFVWVTGGRAVNCEFTKVHKEVPANKKPQQGLKYYPEKIPVNKIAKGDTLAISILNAINNTVPIREQQRLRNTLLYTTDSKAIMYTIQVETIGQAEDVVR